jgi:hypothetical protein
VQGSDRLELEQGLALVKFLGDFSCPNEVVKARFIQEAKHFSPSIFQPFP